MKELEGAPGAAKAPSDAGDRHRHCVKTHAQTCHTHVVSHRPEYLPLGTSSGPVENVFRAPHT